MAGVMSNSTPCFKATLPTAASTGPSMGGWLFQVIVRSPHAQLLMAWCCPAERRLASLQLIGGPPAQAPPANVSAVVQALPSSQDRVFGVPAHTPAAQVSPEVQGLRSSHGTVLGVFTQPVAGSHVSVVHTLPSTQLGGGPPTQTPPAQVSAVVQALPSLQGSVFGAPPTQAAAPSQVLPLMHGLLAQAWPAGSNWPVGEQQSA